MGKTLKGYGDTRGKKSGKRDFQNRDTGIKRKQTAGINGIFRPNINSIRDTQTHLLGGVRNCLFSLFRERGFRAILHKIRLPVTQLNTDYYHPYTLSLQLL